MPKKYRKKPIVIEAIRWTGNNKEELYELAPGSDARDFFFHEGRLGIHTLDGLLTADSGYYIIKGIQGELYPCKPDIFEATYEEGYERVADPDEVFMVVRMYGFTVEQAETMLNNDETREILLANIAGSLEGILSEKCIQKNVYSK